MPPVISSYFLNTVPGVSKEVISLLNSLPAKLCPLEPVPTWLLKRAAEQFPPVLAGLDPATSLSRPVDYPSRCILGSLSTKEVNTGASRPQLLPSDLAMDAKRSSREQKKRQKRVFLKSFETTLKR